MDEWKKNDNGKPDLAALASLPLEQLLTIALVFEHGAAKYSRDNWKGGKFRRYASACLRHIFARLTGARLDAESGLPHLAHAAACILFLLWYDDNGAGQSTEAADKAKPVGHPPPRRILELFKLALALALGLVLGNFLFS